MSLCLNQIFRFSTGYSAMRLVTEEDYPLLFKLRRSSDARYLKAISPYPEKQLHYIREAREKAFRGEELYYTIADLSAPASALGFIRLADIKNTAYFSFHSLILKRHSDPRIAIDAIFSIQRIGFEMLEKPTCDGLTVHPKHARMLRIHRVMGIVQEVSRDENWVYLRGTRDNYLTRRDFFFRGGFGKICFT